MSRYEAHPYDGLDGPPDDVPDGYWIGLPGDEYAEDASLTLHWPHVEAGHGHATGGGPG